MVAAALDPSNWELFPGICEELNRWNEEKIVEALRKAIEENEILRQNEEMENHEQPVRKAKFERFGRPLDDDVDFVQLYVSHSKAMRYEDDFDLLLFWKNEGSVSFVY